MTRLLWDDLQTIDYLETMLKEGRVILAEGDTVLGLLADVSKEGFAQLNSIKIRTEKPYLVLVSDQKKALNLIDKSQLDEFQIENLMNSCWPGPVTLIFKANNELVDFMKASNGTIALRVPAHQGLLHLLDHFDALFSTSANRSGVPVPSTIAEVDKSIMDCVASIVLNGLHNNSTIASTIIDCTDKQLVVIRKGAFDADRLITQFNKGFLN